jgi:hypothetical protein
MAVNAVAGRGLNPPPDDSRSEHIGGGHLHSRIDEP